ncbi:MAG: hypothetical protein OXG11_04635, partial [Chloroflexi bacterium]|nr:hypothetical protein [Chloroflexota bacterium]
MGWLLSEAGISRDWSAARVQLATETSGADFGEGAGDQVYVVAGRDRESQLDSGLGTLHDAPLDEHTQPLGEDLAVFLEDSDVFEVE